MQLSNITSANPKQRRPSSPISKALKVSDTPVAPRAEAMEPGTCLPNKKKKKRLFNYTHLPKKPHKYRCRLARLAGDQPKGS